MNNPILCRQVSNYNLWRIKSNHHTIYLNYIQERSAIHKEKILDADKFEILKIKTKKCYILYQRFTTH